MENKEKNDQNVIDGNIVTENVTKSFIKTHDKSIMVIIGVKDLIIIKREGCSFSYKKKSHTNIKDILDSIKKREKEKFEFGNIIYRPWGSF